LRSAIVWTHGYDIYSPSEDGSVIYHNYTKNPIQRGWESWEDPKVQKQVIAMTDNRYRLLVGVDFKGMVDTTELAKYGWGGVRSYEQYKAFSGITLEQGQQDNNSCKQLHWVPYANATEVEATVGGGWKLHATLAAQGAVLSKKSVGIGKQGTGQGIAQLRQEVQSHAAADVKYAYPAWGFLAGVVATLFVTVSNDSKSRAIRRRFRCMTTHWSEE
ncbi:hypothetical protein BBJ28_00026681, partial [Nothophytophthora sp. Chile5]